MKVGDKVRVKSITEEYNSYIPDMRKTIGKVYEIARIKSINGLVPFGLKVPGAQGEDDLFWYAESDLELVTDRPKVVGILTEKMMVKGVKCRKVLGFQNILSRDELPAKYLDDRPRFVLRNDAYGRARFFDGKRLKHTDDSASECIDFDLPVNEFMYGINNIVFKGDILPETTIQAIRGWLKRACYRLAEIRREERNAWQGEELLEI